MVTVLALLGVLAVLFVAAVLSTREGPILADAPADVADLPLPDGPLQPEDVGRLRFSLAPRGYRMAEVDTALERLAAELADRDRRIALLEAAAQGHEERPAPREATAQDLPLPDAEPPPAVTATTGGWRDAVQVAPAATATSASVPAGAPVAPSPDVAGPGELPAPPADATPPAAAAVAHVEAVPPLPPVTVHADDAEAPLSVDAPVDERFPGTVGEVGPSGDEHRDPLAPVRADEVLEPAARPDAPDEPSGSSAATADVAPDTLLAALEETGERSSPRAATGDDRLGPSGA